MDKKDRSHIQVENAEELCMKIREEADYEIKDILERAKREAERILNEAQKEAEKKREEFYKAAEREIEKARERISSSLNLEKKRVILQEKNRFIEDVLLAVKREAEKFRGSKEYQDFLKKAILEGARIVDCEHIDVFYSFLDERLIRGGFADSIEALRRGALHRDISITFQKGDFRDIGVVVQSKDGRMAYDNRFLSRLKRSYDDIYMRLLKETF